MVSWSARSRATSLFALLALIPAGAARADEPTQVVVTRTVKGRVIDTSTQEGLPAATIQVQGGPSGARTLAAELDGTYVLALEPGTYMIVFSTPQYIEQRRTVVVTADRDVTLDLGLDPV